MPRSARLVTATGTLLAAAALAAGPATAGQDLRSPDARDAADRGAPAAAAPVVVRIDAPADSGLSWDSAAIGALTGAGLLVTLAGGGMLVTRRRAHGA